MTTEQDEGRIARVRMRAYYLSLERGPTTSDEQNWIDAEAAERAEESAIVEPVAVVEPVVAEPVAPPAPEPAPAVEVAPDPRALLLARLPQLVAVAAAGGVPHGRFAALIDAVLAGGAETPLLRLEEALSVLARRKKPAELAAQARGLADLSEDPLVAELRWDVACAELAVLATLEGAGRLAAVGAPTGFACSLGAKKVSLAVQARPAQGSGFASLRARLLREAGAKAADRALVLRTIGAPKNATPGTLDRLTEVATSTTATIAIGELTFDWFAAEPSEGAAALLSALLPGFRREVELAAKAAGANPEQELPFLLAEVVLPAAPEDADIAEPSTDPLGVRELVAKKAAAGAAHLGYSAGSSWLGLLRIDWRSPEPSRTLFIRPAATWPLSYRELAAELDARIVVL